MAGWRFGLCLFAGVALPALIYAAGRGPEPAWSWLWSYPPHPASKVVIAALLAAAVSLVSVTLSARLPRVERAGPRALLFAAVLAIAAAACVRWHYTYLGGDAEIWVNLASHPFLMTSEPFGRWSHYFAYRILAALGHGDGWLAVRASSVAAGTVYLAGLMALAPGVFRRAPADALIAFLFLIPASELFAGYPETTPWVYALTGVYLLAGLRYLALAPARAPWIESLLLMAALWAHGVACFASGAHAVLLWQWLRRGAAPSRFSRRRIATALALAALPFAALAASFVFAFAFGSGLGGSPWYGNALGAGGGPWVAFSPGASDADVQYVFLSQQHRSALLNLVLFGCPLLAVVPFAIRDLRGSRRRETAFLGAALGGLLLFSLFWNPDLGMRRDLDLMAVFSLPAYALAALWIDARLPPGRARVALLAAASASFALRLVPFLRFP